LDSRSESNKISIAKLLFTFTGLYERCVDLFKRFENAVESRRHPNTFHEPDYERILREREGQVDVRIEGGYRESGGDKHAWKEWILVIVGLLIGGWLGRISMKMDDLVKVVVKQEIDEKQIAELRCTVYKVCQ